MRKSRVRLGPHLIAQTNPDYRPARKKYYKLVGLLVLIVLVVSWLTFWKGNDDNAQTADLPQEEAVLGAQSDEINPDSDYIYTVQKTDSLFSISERFQVNWEEIVELNGLQEPYSLLPGQEIKLPQSQVTKRQQFYDNLKNKIYVVEAGETFVGIAQKLNISVTDLLRANPELSSPDFISIGQVLRLP